MTVSESLKNKILIILYWIKESITHKKTAGIPLQILISSEEGVPLLKEYQQMFKDILNLTPQEYKLFEDKDIMKLLIASINKYSSIERFYASRYLTLNKEGKTYVEEKLLSIEKVCNNVESFFEVSLKQIKDKNNDEFLLILQTLNNLAQRSEEVYFIETRTLGERCEEEIIKKAKEEYLKGLCGLNKGMPKGIFPYFYSNSKGILNKTISYVTVTNIKEVISRLIEKYGWEKQLRDIDAETKFLGVILLNEIEHINLDCRPASIYELSRFISSKNPHYGIGFVKEIRLKLAQKGLLEYSDETQIIISPDKFKDFQKFRQDITL